MSKKFAENFINLRKEKGYTQADAAEKLHVSPQAVSKWENGDSMPDVSLLADIAALFDTSIDFLLGVEKKQTVEVVEQPKKGDYSDYFLKILVRSDEEKITVNLPLSVVTMMVGKTGSMEFGKFSLTKEEIEKIIEMVDQGVVGNLIEIEGSDGETINIFVEKRK